MGFLPSLDYESAQTKKEIKDLEAAKFHPADNGFILVLVECNAAGGAVVFDFGSEGGGQVSEI